MVRSLFSSTLKGEEPWRASLETVRKRGGGREGGREGGR